jgi:uncharacterized protein (DUF934 family)
MTIIVTDSGFGPDTFESKWLDLPSDADLAEFREALNAFAGIRVSFPSFADGRGFSIAAQLRRMGFRGRLRAAGHVLSDQYAMARRAGFDEVQIDTRLADRQPESQWLARANWRAHDYRRGLRRLP